MFAAAGFFLIGLTGGFGHCVLMCHPFVLYISGKYIGSKTGYSMLIPHIYYNLGRIFTYSLLGAVAGFFGGVLQYAGSFVNVQKAASIIGGVLLIVYSLLYFFKINIFSLKSGKIGVILGRLKPSNPFVTGVLLGFLPCGLSMGAIIGAASSGKAITGILSMIFFGLGTSIALLLVAIFGSLAMTYSNKLQVLSSVLLFIMGIYFIYSGIRYTL